MYIYIYIYLYLARGLAFARSQLNRSPFRECNVLLASARVLCKLQTCKILILLASGHISLPNGVPKSPFEQCLKYILRNLQCLERTNRKTLQKNTKSTQPMNKP